MNKVNKERIYLDSSLNTVPDYYDRDIVKVLTKNLKEVYIFWGISKLSFEKILNIFECTKEEINFKLKIAYKKNDKELINKEIYLPPFTNNWTLEFEYKVKNLKVEVIAFGGKNKSYSLLHSAEISIPSSAPSKILHKEWLKPSWKQEYETVEINGELQIQTVQKKYAGFGENAQLTKMNEEGNHAMNDRFFSLPDGSSGFMGSSGILGSSSNLLR